MNKPSSITITERQLALAKVRALKAEYDNLCYHCSKKDAELKLSKELEPNSRGFEVFVAAADRNLFTIGHSWTFNMKKTKFVDGLWIVTADSLVFRRPKFIRNPYAKADEKEIENTEHSGFGMTLSIRGWSILSHKRLSMTFIAAEIGKGRSIEDIWISNAAKTLVLDGKVMAEVSAVKSAKLNVSWYYKCCRDTAKERGVSALDAAGRQEVFDRLRDEALAFVENGVMTWHDAKWVRISEDDLAKLCGLFEGVGVSEALHRFLECAEDKGGPRQTR